MRKIIPLLILLMIGCNEENDYTEEVETAVSNPETLVLNENVETFNYGGLSVPVQDFSEDAYLFEGDILISKDFRSAKVYEPGEQVKATARTKGMWPNNTVFYQIDPNLTKQYRVTDAIKHWEANSNIKFVLRADSGGYVYFTPGNGCSSYIGKTGYKQNITLASGCTTGNTIHEIGHALGYWHEQSRIDRNRFVIVNIDNVVDGAEHNFYTYTEMGYDGQELTESLDLSSIMMYGSYAFSKGWDYPTITKLDGSTYSANRSGLSAGDISGINKLYPSGTTEPTYIDGQRYVIYGLTVTYKNPGEWWYYSRVYGWCKVEYRESNGNWYYSRK